MKNLKSNNTMLKSVEAMKTAIDDINGIITEGEEYFADLLNVNPQELIIFS